MTTGFLLGAVVVALAVGGYLIWREQQRDVVKIDVPGFSGEIVTDRAGDGVEIEGKIGRD